MSGQRQSSRLLIHESPLQVLPSLAASIGLNEAIVLQQIHFLIGFPDAGIADGMRWITKSLEAWVNEFPWWSVRTVKQVFSNLKKRGLIITGKYNANKWDHTLWYRIDYDALEAITPLDNSCTVDSAKSVQSDSTKIALSESTEIAPSSLSDKIDKRESPEPPKSVQIAALPKPTKQRERNLVFDAIALGSFNMAIVPKGKGGRTGKLETAIKACEFPNDKPTVEQLVHLSADLTGMYGWYKKTHPGLDAPASLETISKYLSEYRQTVKQRPTNIEYILVEPEIYQSKTEAA